MDANGPVGLKIPSPPPGPLQCAPVPVAGDEGKIS